MCFYDPRNGATFVTLLSLFLTTGYPEMHAMLAATSILLTVLRTSPCCLQEAYCYQMIPTEYSKQSPAWKQAGFRRPSDDTHHFRKSAPISLPPCHWLEMSVFLRYQQVRRKNSPNQNSTSFQVLSDLILHLLGKKKAPYKFSDPSL